MTITCVRTSPGQSGSPAYGTSLAIGTPERAITISSPAAVRAMSCESEQRASYVLYAASLPGLSGLTGLTRLTRLVGLAGLT